MLVLVFAAPVAAWLARWVVARRWGGGTGKGVKRLG